jgi:hypothetical protein
MDNLIESSRTTRPRLEDVVVEAFGENAPLAKNRLAAEASRLEHQHGAPPCDRQVRQTCNSRASWPLPQVPQIMQAFPPSYPGRIRSRKSSSAIEKESPVALVTQDLAQEGTTALGPGVGEELLRRTGLDDGAGVDENDPLGDLACKAHLVGHHHHGHSFLGYGEG